MKRKIVNLGIAATLLMLMLGSQAYAQTPEPEASAPPGNCSGLVCDGTDSCLKDETSPFEITAPEGNVISMLWVKAGTQCFLFQEDGSDGCYTVTGIGTATASAEKIVGEKCCQEISHIETKFDPTAVDLASFTATPREGNILIAWETAMEVDTVGFNVWRNEAPDGPYERINTALIPAESLGGVMGGSYSLTDTDVTPGTRYYYKLEELEVGGTRNWYGPVSTSTPSAPSATTITSAQAISPVNVGSVGLVALTGAGVSTLWRRRKQRQR